MKPDVHRHRTQFAAVESVFEGRKSVSKTQICVTH